MGIHGNTILNEPVFQGMTEVLEHKQKLVQFRKMELIDRCSDMAETYSCNVGTPR